MRETEAENLSEVEEYPEAPQFRLLRRLVSLLLMTLIVATMAITLALVSKLASFGGSSAEVAAAPGLRLAAGERIEAVGFEQGSGGARALVAVEGPEGARRLVVLEIPPGGEILVEPPKNAH
ncbi:DUF6476 family protein [Neomegalonema perideroedes]|uniref:DUF6476 family protein n=1 Tax=Neomegalonema perideroedes TaxID=217219 RepID=UPI00036A56B9|nr:DUF6476 family protein [Neomegalonema perideroedes]